MCTLCFDDRLSANCFMCIPFSHDGPFHEYTVISHFFLNLNIYKYIKQSIQHSNKSNQAKYQNKSTYQPMPISTKIYRRPPNVPISIASSTQPRRVMKFMPTIPAKEHARNGTNTHTHTHTHTHAHKIIS